MSWWQRLLFARRATPERRDAAARAKSLDRTPDKPDSFGYKVSWLTIRTSDPAAVVEALGLADATPANWASGLASMYEHSRGDESCVFISPPVSGWVFAASLLLPYPTIETHHDIGTKFDAMFLRLMKRFDDVQFFGSHRVSDFAGWARALNGKPVRIFAYADGEVLANVGEQTPEEAEIGLADLTGLSPSDAGDKIFSDAGEWDAEEEAPVAGGIPRDETDAKARKSGGHAFPDEADVVELAGLWSIDPTRLAEQGHAPGVGLVARLPENMRQ